MPNSSRQSQITGEAHKKSPAGREGLLQSSKLFHLLHITVILTTAGQLMQAKYDQYQRPIFSQRKLRPYAQSSKEKEHTEDKQEQTLAHLVAAAVTHHREVG